MRCGSVRARYGARPFSTASGSPALPHGRFEVQFGRAQDVRHREMAQTSVQGSEAGHGSLLNRQRPSRQLAAHLGALLVGGTRCAVPRRESVAVDFARVAVALQAEVAGQSP